MANGWVRSLHCKSNAEHDVVDPASTPSKKQPLLPSLSCAASSLAIKDVVLFFPKYPSSKPQSEPKPKPKPKPTPTPTPSPSSPMAAGAGAMVELPVGHSSRRVVEIIFGSTWSTAADRAGFLFPGEIEAVLRVHNPARAVARFEEYRSAVRASAARSGEPRCAADGNEMMRFHCAPSCGGAPAYGAAVAVAAAAGKGKGKGKGIRTFVGSGAAHDSAGGGRGRRAMVVSRVVAGRVRSESEPESEGESVRVGKCGLVVFDPPAILPCFLIIYKI
ncbi:uncharacterized protein LOC109708254 [Ananas comosus]|uniref:Uncharacterized protein LOC109708254 n=1 Tax=Ananas comosus TaxID=4615 RepID=A0A199V9J9_ANACO|nr:uncharacterized protein LOC109708254 [Ananas comosus]OAY73475.1 hypothetical protein ACMD2_21735 [Ananas comosus]